MTQPSEQSPEISCMANFAAGSAEVSQFALEMLGGASLKVRRT